jgi:hypothetical protein
MDAHQLGKLHLQTDYVFENGTSFYERLGDERAAALLKALWAEGYRIAPAQEMYRPASSSQPATSPNVPPASRFTAGASEAS